MQILTREGRYESRSANPYAPWGSTSPPPPGGGFAGGVHISEQTALQLVAVWSSVSLIADSIATLPIKQWRKTGAAEARQIPCSPVIEQPWAEITQRDFVMQGTVSMLLRGNLWGRVVERDKKLLLPSQVKLIHPDRARVRRDPKTGQVEVRYGNELVPPDDVTRAMALSVPEGLEGLNPIEYMRNSLGLARAQDLWAGAFFANSARPDGVIEVPGDLDEEETKRMVLSWNEAHQGINHAHLPAILTGGAAWKAVTMNMADVQFLEQMQFSQSVITGMIYRIPPHMIGMQEKDTSWGSGIEQQALGYVRNTLLIWLCRWEDLMRSWLPPGEFVTFDLSERLRGDTLQRWSSYQIARIIGAMNNQEIRSAEGMPKVTDPDQLAVLSDFAAPLNSAPVKPTSTGGSGGDKAN